jgi:acetyltransferase-like isoleucine patch superfamily enzyme
MFFLFGKKNLKIGKKNKLHRSVFFDLSKGGKIILGSYNEILNGCILMPYGGSIIIGDNCSINPYTILYGHGKGLTIGNNVLIAGHCLIIPANHVYRETDKTINKQGIDSKGIDIEDDVWIGAGCKILDGVKIGRGAIIAAGSVVNKSVASFTLVAGVPAKFLRNRF